MAPEIIDQGQLPEGEWVLVRSRKKSPGMAEGEHLILQFADEREAADMTQAELGSILALALAIAQERAFEPDRYRISVNGPKECTRSHLHVHIILAKGDDAIPKLVAREIE